MLGHTRHGASKILNFSRAAVAAPFTFDSHRVRWMSTSNHNPFFEESTRLLRVPPFDLIKNEHYAEAFDEGMKQQKLEVERISTNDEPATFDNTLLPYERSGSLLTRASAVYYNLLSAHTDDELEELRTKYSPLFAAHRDELQLDPKLFSRVKQVYEKRDELSDAESKRLVEKLYKSLVRHGALLAEEDKIRLKEINGDLAKSGTQFNQNVLKEVNDLAIVVDSREELDGLSDAQIEAAQKEAEKRNLKGKFVLALVNTSTQPVLQQLTNRKLRERIFKTSISRGSRGGDYDNRAVMCRILKLRAQQAQMLGFKNHAEYRFDDQMVPSAEAVNARLAELVPPAVANSLTEAAELQRVIDAEGGNFKLEPWDWTFYTEKVRTKKFSFDEEQMKPYLKLENIIEKGVFFAATKLYGITFKEVFDIEAYHPDVRVWQVHDESGDLIAIFMGDFYARSSKSGGAWMNTFVDQSRLLGHRPVVLNCANAVKPSGDNPCLLSKDDVETMFHEFGHALHGLLSDVNYPTFSGTSVAIDYVEFPSQVNEMWAWWPEVLANYAIHHETGEKMPLDMMDKVVAMEQFNQGYLTTEYLAAAVVDQALHQLSQEEIPEPEDLMKFEEEALRKAGIDPIVTPRYRIPYFSHIASGYSANYFSYIWSEVYDADSVEWFKDNGGLKRENGRHFAKTILSNGGSRDELQMFRDFRGRDADVKPLLIRRGLVKEASL